MVTKAEVPVLALWQITLHTFLGADPHARRGEGGLELVGAHSEGYRHSSRVHDVLRWRLAGVIVSEGFRLVGIGAPRRNELLQQCRQGG
jgi:hypothetical protein